jgi:hypothetical protein
MKFRENPSNPEDPSSPSEEAESVSFRTIPTEFGGRSYFMYDRPNFAARAIRFSGSEEIELPGVVDLNKGGPELTFELPDHTIDSLKRYVDDSFHAQEVRGCYHFTANMLGAERVNYIDAAKLLNQSIGERVEDLSELVPGEPIVVAHPGYEYEDFDGLEIDHAAIVLDDEYCLQIGRVSGPLVVAEYDTILEHYQRVMSTVSARIPDVWKDDREPTPDDIQWYRVDLEKLAAAYDTYVASEQ